MEGVTHDVAFYIGHFLSARDWLSVRCVNRLWAEHFESLCDIPQVALRLGRRLNARFTTLDLDCERAEHNKALFDEVLRANLRAIPDTDAGVVQKLHAISAVEGLKFTREDLDAIVDGGLLRLADRANWIPQCVLDTLGDDLKHLLHKHRTEFLEMVVLERFPRN